MKTQFFSTTFLTVFISTGMLVLAFDALPSVQPSNNSNLNSN